MEITGDNKQPEAALTQSACDTRERLLDAAELLFAQRGFSGSGLRAITERAGANVAAVNYHFGSKAGLLDAVIHRAFEYILERQERLLDEVEPDGRESVRDFVETMVQPFVELSDGDRERIQTIAQLIGRLMSSRDWNELRDEAHDVQNLRERYIAAFTRLVPEVSGDEMRWRYEACVGVIINDQTSPAPGDHPPRSGDFQRERLVNLLLAAITAPPTDLSL